MREPNATSDRVVVPAKDGGLEVRSVKAARGDPREAWQRVLDDDEDAAWAAPVRVDEEGRDMLPTGELTARFAKAPSDDDLDEFARRNGLAVRSRNEFVPSQVVFVPEDPRGTYLPEACERLVAEPEVVSAWPNTRSRYERS